jgi:hypothetical protein
MFVGLHDTARRNAIGPVINGYDFTDWQTWQMSKQTQRILCFVDRASLYSPLQIEPTWCTNLPNMSVAPLFMFRATMCPSSGEIPYLCDTWYLSLYIDDCLVCRAEIIPPCIPYSHLYRVTNTRCRIGTVFYPDDGHIVARNM